MQAFYGKFRRTHTHYHLIEDPFWVPEDLDEWNAMPSTKLQTLIEILKWHLEEDARPPLRVREDGTTPNELEPTPDWFELVVRAPNSRCDLILVYVAFPSNNALICKVSIYTI